MRKIVYILGVLLAGKLLAKSLVLDKTWGFCDSSGVYIYFEDTYQLGKRYNLLSHIGRYCYFVDEYDLNEKPGTSSASAKQEAKHIRWSTY
jgi:hypothetical protein